MGFSLGDDIPDGVADVKYDVEVSIPDVQVHAVANSSLFADDLGEFATPQQHDESSMVEDASIPRHVAEDNGVVMYHCVDSATSRGKVLFIWIQNCFKNVWTKLAL